MDRYEHKQQFKIRQCEADFKNHLKISSALALLQEVACESAEELGIGYSYVHPKGYAFMVSGICCEFLRPIKLWESIIAKTWPLPPTYVIFGREYQFVSSKGDVLANASSRWCLVDLHTGKLAQSKVIEGQDYSTYNTTKVLSDVQWKIPGFENSEGELRHQLTVGIEDYDCNMHVNNARYADYCMHCFSLEELSTLRLSRFQISYIKQCKQGDKLRFYRKRIAEKEYLLQGTNEMEELVLQARLLFVEDEGVCQ